VQIGQLLTILNLQQFAGMKGQWAAVPVLKTRDAGVRVEERAPTAAVRRIIARVIPSFFFMDVSFRKHAKACIRVYVWEPATVTPETPFRRTL
jgi:hypothetical protein